jgi:ABC-type hemin transport system ATPase subunit
MRFSRVELTNFRSFGPGKKVIELPDGENLLAVVGANNAGKSNLIEALRLVLGGRRRYEPQPADFHRLNVADEMRIELHLREPLRRENVFGEDAITAFYFRVWQSPRAPDKGQLKVDHYCLDEQGKIYNPPVRVPKKGGTGGSDDGNGVERLRRLPVQARRVIAQVGPVHYLDPTMYRAFDPTGFGLLARLLDLYREDFRSTDNVYGYETESGPHEMRSVEAFERATDRLRDILSTEKLAEIEAALTRNLASLLGPEAHGAVVNVALPTAEDLLKDALRLQVQDEAGSPVVPVGRLGSGYQSLLRLAILRSYAELAAEERKAVFLMEEPEAYLNPHLRRHLRSVLGELAAAGHDVFLTTHDPAFAPLTEYATVLRLAKQAGSTEWFRCKDAIEFSYERMAQKLRRGGNAECLFAIKVVLCEGQDDVAAVRLLLEKAAVDLDARSVSVLDCGGRENLPDYITLLDSLGIDLFVVSDGDSTTVKDKPEIGKHVEKVKAAAGERLFLFEEDIEHELSLEKLGRANVFQIVEAVEALDPDKLDSDAPMRSLRDALVAFVDEPASSVD